MNRTNRRPGRLRWLAALGSFIFAQSTLMAEQNVGFIEDFALAENREDALKQLIPGTEDYYYYHALHYQNEREIKLLDEMMDEWRKQFVNSSSRKMIENREALIRYSDDPEATLEYLKKELGLQFNHQQEGKAREANHPSELDQKLISWQAFLDDALASSDTLQNLEEAGFYLYLESKPEMTKAERRHLLSRATIPDLPGLLDVIATDLKSKESKGFGEFSIHRALTKKQLEELLQKQKNLINNENYVHTYLGKLQPGADENIASNPDVRAAYFERAWEFVSSLAPSFNSLKAHLLYQRLVHDRALGREIEARFVKYLALPRNVSYLNPDWRKRQEVDWRYAADLGQDYRKLTSFPPIGADQKLVEYYLLHFLKDQKDYKKFLPYLRESWLRKIFAEAKITNGIGKPGDWASLLSPTEFQALKDRVDIEFESSSREVFGLEDEVKLDVNLKNVPKLIVKVFEINTLNYYRNYQNEVSTDIDLDGLVANKVEVHEYQDAPQLRKLRSFEIKSIGNRRGLWVVEFIGGGKSSRAVIRKGALGVLNQTTPNGELVTVLDENHQPIKNAGLWIGEKRFDCDQSGRVVLPFSNEPGERSVVVEDGRGFATMARIVQPGEVYQLAAGMHLEQESLRTGSEATIVVRPTLTVAGETISLEKVESASLHLSSVNLDGLPATSTVPDFKLFSDRESVHQFRVPDRLTQLTATLRVKVKVASQGGKEIELTDSRTFKVNEFLKSDHVGSPYLSKISGKYRIEYLGRNGEALGARNLTVNLTRDGFKNQRYLTLKTNEEGAIDLGVLDGIRRIRVQDSLGHWRQWNLLGDRRDQVGVVTLSSGQELKIPHVGNLTREEVGFFSYLNGSYVADVFSRLELSEGYLIADDLPAGDYRLLLKSSQQTVRVLVSKGEASKGYVFSDARMLELPVREPSHLESLNADGEALEIKVSGADDLTRVHLIATRFLPGYDPFGALGGSQRSGLQSGRARFLPSLYISGRNLGDELRYILERRYAEKFPGNMLTRPEILLNPWAVRDTESGQERLAGGDHFGRVPTPTAAPAMEQRLQEKSEAAKRVTEQSTSYEFLHNDPVFLTNLVPDEDGVLNIKLDAFGDRQHVHVLLVDPDGATYRSVSLEDRVTELRDLRLLNALDPKRHFTEKEQVSLLKKGDAVKLPDLLNSQFEVFDHLGSIYQYFLTLNNDANLREFSFITRWPSLSEEEKTEKYSKYACHELSFFLSRKDPDFFKKVVAPHLENKKDRTFMDDYLLEGESVEKYLQPYEYDRLNVVERLLLARGNDDRREALALDLEHRLALQTRDLEQSQYFFGAAVAGGAFGDTYAGRTRGTVTLESSVVDGSVKLARNNIRALGLQVADGESAMEGLDFAESKKSVERRSRGLKEVEKLRRKSKPQATGGRKVDAFVALDDGIVVEEQPYRSLEPTKEWAENNYYHVPINQHVYELIDENRFWLDLARHGFGGGFGSRHLGEATGNFPEMMLALAVLDLPFEAPEHQDEIEDGALSFTAGGPALLFHREIKEAGMAEKRPPLLVSQSFYQQNDRFRMEDGEKVDKFITDEFVRGVVYGTQIVVTNPTSSRQRLAVLNQIPKGAIPVIGHRATSTTPIELQPYSTNRLEVAFYFPASGEFPLFPAHLSKDGSVVAHAETVNFKVVDEPSRIDQTSWAWISQWAESDAVLKYLATSNLHAIDLEKIAWRCREDAEFFANALATLSRRGIYQSTLQSYAIAHNAKEHVGQFLLMQQGFLNGCGLAISSDLITVDPINRRVYEHLEYKPLINNRAHPLGGQNRILNPVIRDQYQKFLQVLSQRKSLDEIDRLGVTYYLFLQDRISEALAHLSEIDAANLDTTLQYDYFKAYAAFYQEDLASAKRIADKYAEYPVDRWRDRFAEITGQIAEIEGANPLIVEEGDRDQEQEAAAAREPSLALEIEGVKAILDYQNVEEVIVNYYEMDLEFLFSTNPFVSSGTSRFSIIRPNKSETIKLDKEGKKHFELPKDYQASNLIVEVLGAGKKASKAVYANGLKTSLSESMGLLSVREDESGKPLSKVYIKVYARTNEGVKFFKDGYTDLRGKFDYASVSTTGLGQVDRFAILVMSEDHGATVLEAAVPQR